MAMDNAGIMSILQQGTSLTPLTAGLSGALQIGGMVADYNAARKAQEQMAINEAQMKARRSGYEGLYRQGLLNQMGLKSLYNQGQIARDVGYQNRLSALGNQTNINTQMGADELQKRGMGSNSGLAALTASNNARGINQILSNEYLNRLNSIGNPYEQLSHTAQNYTPESLLQNRQMDMYGEYKNPGENLKGLGSYIQELLNQKALSNQTSSLLDAIRLNQLNNVKANPVNAQQLGR